VSVSHIEITMDEVGAEVASRRPVALHWCLPSDCNGGGAALELCSDFLVGRARHGCQVLGRVQAQWSGARDQIDPFRRAGCSLHAKYTEVQNKRYSSPRVMNQGSMTWTQGPTDRPTPGAPRPSPAPTPCSHAHAHEPPRSQPTDPVCPCPKRARPARLTDPMPPNLAPLPPSPHASPR
jgi:hypothetical protein